MNRDKIIKKINDLRNLASHPTTEPHLVDASIRKYEKLMEQYNLSMDDLTLREEGVTVSGFKSEKGGNTLKTRNPMGWAVLPIKRLTNTALIAPRKGLNNWQFIGNKADVEYADWIYNLIKNSMENAAMAFRIGKEYHVAINTGVKGADAIHAFKQGFVFACAANLRKMVEEQTGNALMVVKQELVTSFLSDHKLTDLDDWNTKQVATRDNTLEFINSGIEEGNKVKLRKALDG